MHGRGHDHAVGQRVEVTMMTVLRNPDHVTIAVGNVATAIEFFELLGFRKEHVVTIDGGAPARYMGMPDMKASDDGCDLATTSPPAAAV
jgi:catechol 2,3-dioxygenase-like lactoylglutathione lyase family enzyme